MDHRSSRNNNKKGMTLIEILMATLLASTLILAALDIYQGVSRAASRYETMDGFFVREQFLRDQVKGWDMGVMNYLKLDPRSLFDTRAARYVTLNSARYGKGNLPVLAEIRIENDRLVYREKRLRGWSTLNDKQLSVFSRGLESVTALAGGDVYQQVFMMPVRQGRIRYWDDKSRQFVDVWRHEGQWPQLIELTFTYKERNRRWLIGTMLSVQQLEAGAAL